MVAVNVQEKPTKNAKLLFLTEFLIALMLLSILAAICVPAIDSWVSAQKLQMDYAAAENIASGAGRYLSEHPNIQQITVDDLKAGTYVSLTLPPPQSVNASTWQIEIGASKSIKVYASGVLFYPKTNN